MKNQFSLFATPEPSIEGIDAAKAFASYSADTIGDSSKVRKPVSCNGDLWVNTGGSYGGGAGKRSCDMYRLVPVAEFEGEPTTYYAKLAIVREGDRYAGDYARNDPNGFYHGMTVRCGSETYVMCGPKHVLIADDVPTLFSHEDDGDVDGEDDAGLDLFEDDDDGEDDGEDDGDDDDDGEDDDGVYDGLDDGGRSRIGDTWVTDENDIAA